MSEGKGGGMGCSNKCYEGNVDQKLSFKLKFFTRLITSFCWFPPGGGDLDGEVGWR